MAARRVSAVVVGVLLVAGCARPVSGSPVADQKAADQAKTAAYDQGIKAFQSHFAKLGDEQAKVYNYITFADQKRTNEFESAKVGNPPATALSKRRDSAEEAVLIVHPAGAPIDYVKLDRRHANLAPTLWVSTPADLQPGDPFTPQHLLTSWFAVQLDSAIAQTKRNVPDQQRRSAEPKPDGSGYELDTGATLGTMMDKGIATVAEELKSKVTPEMKAAVLPVRMEFDSDWNFTKLEVRASVPSDSGPLELQVGYEVAGKASKSDIPAAPLPTQVTAITDPTALATFWKDLGGPGTGA